MERWTEREVLTLLRRRHAATAGNGPAWAYLEQVRDDAGFAAKRTADALAVHLWQSRGNELHGFEVKVSRSDWRRELADPEKADGWCQVVDRWWIVAPSGVVPVEELPPTWGLLDTAGDPAKLRVRQQAPLLCTERAAVPRGLLVTMLRAAGAGLQHTPDEQGLKDAEARGYARGVAATESGEKRWHDAYDAQTKILREAAEVEREMNLSLGGISFRTWRDREGPTRIRQVGSALRKVLAGDEAERQAQSAVERAAQQLEDAARRLRGSQP